MSGRKDREEQRIHRQWDNGTRAQKNMSTRNPTNVTTTRTRTKSYDKYTDGDRDKDDKGNHQTGNKRQTRSEQQSCNGRQVDGGQEGYVGNQCAMQKNGKKKYHNTS